MDEKVLCYEPDKNKARVLYESKVSCEWPIIGWKVVIYGSVWICYVVAFPKFYVTSSSFTEF